MACPVLPQINLMQVCNLVPLQHHCSTFVQGWTIVSEIMFLVNVDNFLNKGMGSYHSPASTPSAMEITIFFPPSCWHSPCTHIVQTFLLTCAYGWPISLSSLNIFPASIGSASIPWPMKIFQLWDCYKLLLCQWFFIESGFGLLQPLSLSPLT